MYVYNIFLICIYIYELKLTSMISIYCEYVLYNIILSLTNLTLARRYR